MSEHGTCVHEDRWDDVRGALARIESQTTRTNGRVGKIEKAIVLIGGILIGASAVAGYKIANVQDAAAAALSAASTAAKAVTP